MALPSGYVGSQKDVLGNRDGFTCLVLTTRYSRLHRQPLPQVVFVGNAYAEALMAAQAAPTARMHSGQSRVHGLACFSSEQAGLRQSSELTSSTCRTRQTRVRTKCCREFRRIFDEIRLIHFGGTHLSQTDRRYSRFASISA